MMTPVKKGRHHDGVDRTIEHALRLGDFIGYNAAWSFIADLEDVAKQIEQLLPEEAERAIVLYETFIAGCYEKAEEIDDSNGNLGMFVENLFCSWIKARQAAQTDSERTVEILLGWMEQDDYGFCYQLETEAVKVLDKNGLKHFASQVQKRFDAARQSSKTPNDGKCRQPDTRYRHRYWAGILKTIYAAQRNLDAYIAFCRDTELLPVDCENLARMLQARRKPEQALQWVEKGLELEKQLKGGSGASYELDDLKRKLLVKLGHSGVALASAWAEFEAFPSKLAYEQLMEYVPKGERATWHAKSIETSDQADLDFVIELLLATKEIDRLAERLRHSTHQGLEALSHYTSEPAAKKMERPHPDVAAKVYRALGMCILNSKKSRYYDDALSYFEQARRCYKKAGDELAWQALVEDILQNHQRKSAFMPGFEKLLQGKKLHDEFSFVERINRQKRTWNK